MNPRTPEVEWKRNRFLAVLPEESRHKLLTYAVQQSMHLKSDLYAEYVTPRFAYFPLSGVASVVALTADGETSEVGFIGCEGLIGAYHLLGPAAVSTRCFIQIEGNLIRVPFGQLASAYKTDAELKVRILEFIQADSLSVSQMAGCNQMHDLRPRLARWLLMANDRHNSDTLGVTHEILAQMVAARRTTVTKIAGQFQEEGLIEYARGRVRILSRARMQNIACACYAVSQKLFTDLYKL